MAGITYGTNYSWTVAADKGSTPKDAPEALVHTRAVETKAGWIGQVIIGGAIVWESLAMGGDADTGGRAAQQAANTKVIQVFTDLFVRPRSRPRTPR
jgi:hypothetical protein